MYQKHARVKAKKLFESLAITRQILFLFWNDMTDPIERAVSRRVVRMLSRHENSGAAAEYRVAAKVKAINRALRQLKTNQYIIERKTGKQVEYILSDKGKIAALHEAARLALRYTDGNQCLVSFDIPQSETILRKKFVYLLKDLDFTMFHKSVWASDKMLAPMLIELVKDMGAISWVHIYEAHRMEDNLLVKKGERHTKNLKKFVNNRKSLIEKKNKILPGIAGRKRFH